MTPETAVEQMEAEMAAEAAKKERREKYKDLRKYEVSEEFKELIAFSEAQQEKYIKEIRDLLSWREEAKTQFSPVDERLAYIHSLDIIISAVTNENFKQYLKKRREAHDSFVLNRSWEDQPIYTSLDLIKFKRQEFFNIPHYLEFAIESFNDDEAEEEDNSAY